MLAVSRSVDSSELPDLIDQIRPSIVGIGTQQKLRRPPNNLSGTGFVVGNGNFVITNAHVTSSELDTDRRERRVVFVGRGKKPSVREARVVRIDDFHDLALLQFDGPPVAALRLGDSATVREGQSILFTGFPIGAVLGLYPVTHQGIVSAISPSAIPQHSIKDATAKQLRSLREPFDVLQLDATAYPGNSGSPVIDRSTGLVIGVINSVLVKSSKENVLKDPSAISYAIPVKHATALIAAETR
ncbi:MAG: S1 family peptidase [Gammaproteobacteria bacterium]